jgi:hypothetical protein
MDPAPDPARPPARLPAGPAARRRPPRRSARRAAALLAIAALAGGAPAVARKPTEHVGDWAPADAKEVSRFCKDHTTLRGRLTIGPAWTGVDLGPLRCLQRLQGDLVIAEAPALERLDGLDGLQGNQGVALSSVRITDNPRLDSIGGLGAAGLKARDLTISGNPRLQRVDGLPELVSGGSITITGNPGLVELRGPTGHKPGVALSRLSVTNNPSLERVTGWANVARVDEIEILVNPSLHTLGGLPDLRHFGRCTLRGLPGLPAWTFGLSAASGGALHIEDNDALTALPPYPELMRLDELLIRDNDALVALLGIGGRPGAPPAVDAVLVEANSALSPAAIDALLARLSLPPSPDAVRVRLNGAEPRP